MINRIQECIEILEEDMAPMQSFVSAPKETIEKYRGLLPGALIASWEKLGWRGFNDGLFWLVNPADYDDLVDIWLDDTPFEEIDHYHIVARNAFGKLYAWGQEYNQKFTISCPMHALIAQEKKIRVKSDDPDRSLGSFLMSQNKKSLDIKDENKKPLFDRALKKLGPLAADEMYGFEQPLFAGGRLMLDNLAKVKLDQHLTLLRQMGGKPKIPFANISVDV